MSDDAGTMYEKMVSGTGIIFSGLVIALFLGFVTRTVLARFLGPEGYGLVTLGYTVATATAIVTKMGLPQGVARYVSTTDSERNERGIILSALTMAVLVSVLISGVLVLFAGPIARIVFNKPKLIGVIQIFAIAVSMLTIREIVIAAFRGYERTTERVVISNLLAPISKVVLVVVAVLLGYGFLGAAVAWTISLVLTTGSALYLLYTRTSILTFGWFEPHYSMLLVFSLPLLLSSATWTVIRKADNLFIGYFLSSSSVGIYDSSFLVGRLLLTGVRAFGFLFMPIFSDLYASGETEEMNRLYKIMTKWMASITLPLYLLIVFYPETLLTGLFGKSYAGGSIALIIISTGFYVHVLAGLVGNALTSMEQTKTVMYGNAAAAVGNVTLNYLLIPIIGIEGAAIASAVSYSIANGYLVYRLYSLSGITPFSRSLFYPVASTFVLALLLTTVLNQLITVTFWLLPLIFVGYTFLYLVVFFLTGGVQREDLSFITTVENQMGINLSRLKTFVEGYTE